MDIYKEDDYRSILRQAVEERKALDPGANFQKLAEAMRVPKSYLSKALGGTADLSGDQLYLACEHLQLTAEERDYLLLLHEASRTALTQRRRVLQRKIEKVQREHASAEVYLEAPVVDAEAQGRAEYFLDPWATIVHMALLVPRLRTNLPALAGELGVARELLNRTIALLERHKLVARERGGLKVLVESMHLPSSAGVYRAWRANLRSLGAGRLEATTSDDAYAMNVVFAADRKTAHALRLKILELLRDAEPLVRDAPAEGVYQLAIELFPWLNA
jgi:uncharacterized protein (TIGR02147 family)